MHSARSSRSIRARNGKKRVKTDFELQLTSMLDVLVIILVFLLKSYATSSNNFSTATGVHLPYSGSRDVTPDSLQVVITRDAITFENERVLEFQKSADSLDNMGIQIRAAEMDEAGMRILPLFDALLKAREQAEVLRAKSKARDAQGNPLPFDGILAIQADKRVPYDLLRKVMYTAAAAGYQTFRFLAIRKQS